MIEATKDMPFDIDKLADLLSIRMGIHQDSALTMVSPSVVQVDVEKIHRVPVQTSFVIKGNRDQFVTLSGQQTILKASKGDNYNEHRLIIQMTKKLNGFATALNYVFVNTEESPWIRAIHDQSKNYEKPDGLVSLEGLYEKTAETGSDGTIAQRKCYPKTSFLFGRGVWAIRDMYGGIFEAKLHITPADRGILYGYLQHMSRNDPLSKYRGMLFDKTSFVVAECVNMRITYVMENSLTAEGSFEFIKDFFSNENRWLALLKKLCKKLKVKLVYPRPDISASAFLGAGRFGRCFSVISSNGHVKVLKCVCLADSDVQTDQERARITQALVSAEFDQMRSLNARNVQGVMNVVEGSMTLINTDSDTLLGMGYLMEMLGKPIKRELCCGPDGLTMRLKLGLSLLNFHVNGIYHGDPRISNALLDDRDEVIWADWLLLSHYSTRKNDIETLVKSIYGQDILSEAGQMKRLVKAYIEATDAEAMKNALNQMMGMIPQENE